jgi:hypothetical protein
MTKVFDIYIEGHNATGGGSPASYVGFGGGETFSEACESYFRTQRSTDFGLYDSERNTFWGCHLFETLDEAQRTFG